MRKKPQTRRVKGAEQPKDAPAEGEALAKVMFVLPPRQIQGLRREALRVAMEENTARSDASRVLRRILDGELDPSKVIPTKAR